MAESSAAHEHHPSGSLKETLTSITIAFAVAFIFRAFVIEAYVIPTGSMAPTLMGAHVRMHDDQTGEDWPVNYDATYGAQVMSTSGKTFHSPSTGTEVTAPRPFTKKNVRWGDRILVEKFLPFTPGPKRFDVVVFKAPHQPFENYIKRLIGLPHELVALVDGDVFVRKDDKATPPGGDYWSLDGWQIQRKPERVQRAVWQLVFDSRLVPLQPTRDGRRWFKTPWTGDTSWDTSKSAYTYSGSGATELIWDDTIMSIDDAYPFNEDRSGHPVFPVSDIRMVASIRPENAGLATSAVIEARQHEFRMDISGDTKGRTVTLRMRSAPKAVEGSGEPDPTPGDWVEMATAKLSSSTLAPGKPTVVEFWHVDQSLQAWVNGKKIASAEYNWQPHERADNATTTSRPHRVQNTPLKDGSVYRRPHIRWEFDKGPLTVEYAVVERDLHYQAPPTASRARATHPRFPAVTGKDGYFFCGDNSPGSLDCRLFGLDGNELVNPWVPYTVDGANTPFDERVKDGIVPGDLLLGRAFFVYLPSIERFMGSAPVIDFGRMRWIW
ncbi:MAG: hypothetical protein H6815_06660 [Phycisphaeraceae bacterium]|nr:hypothetical protein [Phycisphaerales bacterium]MCB9860120.1 hypothetical protein [Phycisphaeraceae bacterium]